MALVFEDSNVVDIAAGRTLPELLRWAAGARPGKTFLITEDDELTYGDLAARGGSVAACHNREPYPVAARWKAARASIPVEYGSPGRTCQASAGHRFSSCPCRQAGPKTLAAAPAPG
jgi:hypothetical protein